MRCLLQQGGGLGPCCLTPVLGCFSDHTLQPHLVHPDHAVVPPGHITAFPGHTAAPPSHTTAPSGHVVASPGHTMAPPDHITAPPSHITASPGHIMALPSHLLAVMSPSPASKLSRQHHHPSRGDQSAQQQQNPANNHANNHAHAWHKDPHYHPGTQSRQTLWAAETPQGLGTATLCLGHTNPSPVCPSRHSPLPISTPQDPSGWEEAGITGAMMGREGRSCLPLL